ncbi:M16 family metallopeptidase [Roseateles sp. BYS180W]|uniref:M16 family metallopeptidase n=1 Tax=Roseateles rivi TaxID=3299028 RepID=A0ABW7FYK9_9BURK
MKNTHLGPALHALALALSLAWPMSTLAAPAKASTPSTQAAAKPQLAVRAEFVREMGGISEYRLPNGLQILLFSDEAQSTTTVNITYRVGSRHEVVGEYGMAHLLEHLLFKDTPKHKDIPGAMAARGVRFNGTTTVDRTNYFGSFNAKPETLDFVLALEADRMVNNPVAQSDLDKEMSVVRNEFERAENQPMQVLSQRVAAAAYAWHPYGKPTIGSRSDIEKVSIDKLRAFYKRYYRPDNATLLVAGKFDVEATLARIQTHFGPVARPAEPIVQPYTVEPAQDGERSVVVRRVGGQPLLLNHYHVPAISHPDTPALIVYSALLSLRPSGQLYKGMTETKKALGAGLQSGGGVEPGGASLFAVLPPDADVDKIERELQDIVEGRSLKPFDEAQLQRVRDMVALGYREAMKNPEGLIQSLSGLVAAGDWRLLFQLIEDLPKVTLADVERVRKHYFRAANRTSGRYLPAQEVTRVEIPAAPPLVQRLADLKGPPKVEQGEVFEPTPERLTQRTQVQRLPSGIELLSLNKQTRGNTVVLKLDLRWGERDATFARAGTDVVAQLLSEGSASLDKQALQDTMLKLRANLSVASEDQGATLTLTTEKDTLIPALKIAAELMQQPRLPQDALERVRKSVLASLQGARQDLGALRREAVREHYNKAYGVSYGHPDYQQSLDDRIYKIQKLTLEEVRAFHQDYWSANEARVSVVGALPEGLAQAVEQYFGSWKKPQAARFVRHEAKHQAVPSARFDVVAKDKANAVVHLQQNLPISQRDADYSALVLAAQVFGESGLSSRLSQRVRQKEGLSYGISADLNAPYWGQAGDLSISASCAPDKRDAVLAAVQDELQRMQQQPISAEELERARTQLLEARKQGRSAESNLAAQLLNQAARGTSWADVQAFEQALRAVTPEQASAAWRRVVRSDGFVISTAGDFKS